MSATHRVFFEGAVYHFAVDESRGPGETWFDFGAVVASIMATRGRLYRIAKQDMIPAFLLIPFSGNLQRAQLHTRGMCPSGVPDMWLELHDLEQLVTDNARVVRNQPQPPTEEPACTDSNPT